MGRLILINKIVVFKFDIKKTIKALDIEAPSQNCTQFSKEDADSIARFFKRNNYGLYMTTDEVIDEFDKGHEFFGVKHLSETIAGMWIHTGQVNINAPSFEALKDRHNNIVCFEKNTVYSSHNLVDASFRGQHLYSDILKTVLYTKKDKVDNYIYITGFDNKKMIKSGLKYNGQIIGIAYVYRFFKYIWVRKYYSFGEKNWKCI